MWKDWKGLLRREGVRACVSESRGGERERVEKRKEREGESRGELGSELLSLVIFLCVLWFTSLRPLD